MIANDAASISASVWARSRSRRLAACGALVIVAA
jgi:hypothetical protein